MAETYFPFDAGAGANVTEAQWRQMADLWRKTGVIPEGLTQLESYGDNSGMQVKVKTGKAWVKGHYYENDSEKVLAIGSNSTGSSRLDRVIIRADFAANTVLSLILPGTSVLPALTQDTAIWEVSLATVTVPNNASSIVAGNVVDDRQYSPNPVVETWPGSTLPTVGNFEGRKVYATALTGVEFRNKEYVFRGGIWHLVSPFRINVFGSATGNLSLTTILRLIVSINFPNTPCPVHVYPVGGLTGTLSAVTTASRCMMGVEIINNAGRQGLMYAGHHLRSAEGEMRVAVTLLPFHGMNLGTGVTETYILGAFIEHQLGDSTGFVFNLGGFVPSLNLTVSDS